MIIGLLFPVDSQGQILGHLLIHVDNIDACLFQILAELS